MPSRIHLDDARIAGFCRRHGIRRLSLFGSALTTRFGPESDVDVLVEFRAGRVPGLLRMAAMERELAAIIGRKVDLRTPEDLSRHFRADVLAKAEVHYAES